MGNVSNRQQLDQRAENTPKLSEPPMCLQHSENKSVHYREAIVQELSLLIQVYGFKNMISG